jgi:hypothetical protein
MKKTLSRYELERSPRDGHIIQLAKEVLLEVDLSPTYTEKPYHAQLVYAWALIFECRAAWRLQILLADALRRYAETL